MAGSVTAGILPFVTVPGNLVFRGDYEQRYPGRYTYVPTSWFSRLQMSRVHAGIPALSGPRAS
eukprot:133975-Rhodomonas_salina.1